MCDHLNIDFIISDGELLGLECVDCGASLTVEQIGQLFIVFGDLFIKYFTNEDME